MACVIESFSNGLLPQHTKVVPPIPYKTDISTHLPTAVHVCMIVLIDHDQRKQTRTVRPGRSKIGISRTGASRSRAGVSAGASSHHGGGVGGVRVFLNGVNVTPQSLLGSSSQSAAGGRGNAGATTAAAAAAAGKRKASGGTATKRPSGGGVAPRKSSSFSVEALQSSVVGKESGRGVGGGSSKSPTGRRKRAGEGTAEEGGLTEEDLSAPVTIGLRETPTMMLLEIRGSAVAMDLRDFGRCAVISDGSIGTNFSLYVANGFNNSSSEKPTMTTVLQGSAVVSGE